MSNTISAPVANPDHRPWHGHDNPLEALFQYIDRKTKSPGEVAALKADVAALKQQITALEQKFAGVARPIVVPQQPAAPSVSSISASPPPPNAA